MEVDSADEQDEEAKSQGGQTQSQVSKSNNTGATFNTLSSLGSLRPGITLNACSMFQLSSLCQLLVLLIARYFSTVLCERNR